MRPASRVLGAEIDGLDLGEPIDEKIGRSLRRALSDHLVLFLRAQDLSPDDQCRFASVFGELVRYPFLRSLREHPLVTPVIKEPWDSGVFGGGWHTDTPYLPRPAKATVLYAKEVPEKGGDTLFANLYLAYEALEERIKQRLKGLEGVFTSARIHSLDGDLGKLAGRSEDKVEAPEIASQAVCQPLVRTHPESGRLSLYVSPPHLCGIAGMEERAAQALIKQLSEHATRDAFTYRFSWQAGSVAVWDNRCLLHRPLDDYAGQRRVMHRVSVAG